MKIRAGFVSNSSSSSFIVASEGPAEVVVKADLSKYADRTVRTIEELDAAILEDYGWKQTIVEELLAQGDDWLKRMYLRAREAVEGGKTVLFGTVSSEGEDGLEQLLYNNGIPETPGVEIILDRG